MDARTTELLFALLRSAIDGKALSEKEKNEYSPECLPTLLKIAAGQDVAHLVAWALKQNGLLTEADMAVEKYVMQAVFRYEKIQYELDCVTSALEKAQIPFLPLKGSVIRKFYPEAWMRTSCDIDVLVHREDLDRAMACLMEELEYKEHRRATHDVAFFSPSGVHVELHFDLVEEGRANRAREVLRLVWEDASLCEKSEYRYEMSDAFFYFYHLAHMAKHFEDGGCGVRPFLDLWILDRIEGADIQKRDVLLKKAELSKFTAAARDLSRVWFEGEEAGSISLQMQAYLFHGGVYGSSENRVALHQGRNGGRFGYLLSRVFVPYSKLKRYYPILEKHRYLMPVMQVRRWFMLLKPNVAKIAKSEMTANNSVDRKQAEQMHRFLDDIGL